MISKKHKFLFIHVPKTGGNSIQNILKTYSDDNLVINHPQQDGVERFELANDEYHTTKHSTLTQYKKTVEARVFEKLFKFAVIRNPWERAISHYFLPIRDVKEWDRDDFLEFIDEVKPIEYYITTPGKWWRKFYIPHKDQKASRRLDHELDFLIKFENLQADFNEVCDRIGIPRQEFPRRNASERDHYSKYYDDELVALVQERFRKEIEFGNYEFG